jgi:hypothetical protein
MRIEAELFRIDRADSSAQQQLQHADPVRQNFVERFRATSILLSSGHQHAAVDASVQRALALHLTPN